MILALPETARQVVGNGSISGSWIHRAPLSGFRPKTTFSDREMLPRPFHIANPLSSVKILRQPDSTLIILTISILYAVSCCMQASLSTLFIRKYALNQIEAGLIYLPYGVGCALAALFTGKQLDWDYQTTAKKHGMPVEKRLRNRVCFPIEEARLRNVWYPLTFATAGTIGYGWTLRYQSVSLTHHLTGSRAGLISYSANHDTINTSIWPWRCDSSLFHGNIVLC